jgi:hypothetical protein
MMLKAAEIRVLTANAAFYRMFEIEREETESRSLYDLSERQWDDPALREQLEQVLPRNKVFDDFEIVRDFPRIGHRTMMLNARRLEQAPGATPLILLAIEDVTAQRRAEGVSVSGWRSWRWRIGARMNSWRCWPTSCAIHWRRFAPLPTSWESRRRPLRRLTRRA